MQCANYRNMTASRRSRAVWTRLLAASSLCAVLAGSGSGCKPKAPAADANPPLQAAKSTTAPQVTVIRTPTRTITQKIDVTGALNTLNDVTVGVKIAGRITAVYFREGDRVMALLAGGGYAEKARVPAAQAMRIPKGLSFEEAAAVPEAFLTAWLNLALLGELEQGEVVVVHAAASGVGSAALQLCRGIASVLLATASPAKHDACRALGATHVLARDEVQTKLAETVQAAAGRGADLIFDMVGASYLDGRRARHAGSRRPARPPPHRAGLDAARPQRGAEGEAGPRLHRARAAALRPR